MSLHTRFPVGSRDNVWRERVSVERSVLVDGRTVETETHFTLMKGLKDISWATVDGMVGRSSALLPCKDTEQSCACTHSQSPASQPATSLAPLPPYLGPLHLVGDGFIVRLHMLSKFEVVHCVLVSTEHMLQWVESQHYKDYVT